MIIRVVRTLTFLSFALMIFAPLEAIESRADAKSADADAAETEALAGHSYHGEFLNEGPRQQAYLMNGTGAVKFPVTTKNPQAQAFIEQGVGQLYGFWYLEAERSFRQAAMFDSDCAMAYWGAALATRKADQRAKGFIAEAVKRKKSASKREQMYIEALDEYLNFALRQDEGEVKGGKKKKDDKSKPTLDAEQKKKRAEEYTKALEAIALQYPDDIEAKAFLALQLYENKGDLPNPSILAVDGLMDKVFAAQPMHPAHHFRIHLWDHKKPEAALESAALCGPSAPAIAHMWHMPGHIYSRLKRYHDAVWQQEASARVDHAHMIRDGVLPDQIHNFAHNNEWLIRNLNHIGRFDAAVDLAKNMIELPQHPKYNTLDKQGSATYGRLRLIETLARYELWQQAIELSRTPLLQPTGKEKEQLARLRLLGIARFMNGQPDEGNQALAELQARLKTKRAEQTEAGDKAARKAIGKAVDEVLVKKAGEQARRDAAANQKTDAVSSVGPESATQESVNQGSTDAASPEEADQKAIDAIVAAAEKRARDEQIEKQRKAIDKARLDAKKPLATPIKDLVKAVAAVEAFREIAAGNFEAALPLVKQAGRNVSPFYLALVQLRSGDPKAAIATAKKEVDKSRNEVQPLAWLAYLYAESGDSKLAKETFERLRKLSSQIDLDSVVFERVKSIATELGYPDDWRCEPQRSDDLGERPELDSLGPFRWHPAPAPPWQLTDSQGVQRSLAEYTGRPVVAIFYLGFGCLHCAEQLQAFAPMAQEYSDAGIEIVAVSSDREPDLQKSINLYDGKPLPFPLIADPKLQTFKAYRAFDDFEDQPLHGTFLIDREGLIRWQDIGFEPFMEPEFLLDEAKRLLGRDGQ